jgi:hypothetical protein
MLSVCAVCLRVVWCVVCGPGVIGSDWWTYVTLRTQMGAALSTPPTPTATAEELEQLRADCERRFEAYMACVDRHKRGPNHGLRLDDCEEEAKSYRGCQKQLKQLRPK